MRKKYDNKNTLFSYQGNIVLLILGLIALILTLPNTVTSLSTVISGNVASKLEFIFALNSISQVFFIPLATFAGMKWIAHKQGKKYSLIVGFLITLGAYFVLTHALGLVNSFILIP